MPVWEALGGEQGLGFREIAVYIAAVTYAPLSVSELADRLRICRKSSAEACRRLAAAGWMLCVRSGRSTMPVPIVPHQHQQSMVEELSVAYASAGNKGEFLLKRYLDMRVACHHYLDNYRPGFAVHPLTLEPLEYDRLYIRHKVAFEFNGPQHDGPTDKYSDAIAAADLKVRDMVKDCLSRTEGVSLVVVTVRDLVPDTLDLRLPPVLPRRPVDRESPYFKAWDGIRRRHRRKALKLEGRGT